MRYAPYTYETIAIAAMSETELLEYFLTRFFETEEVWGLGDGCDWLITERGEQLVMPLWPYRQLAEEAASGDWASLMPEAESMEIFMEETIAMLIEDGITIEVMSGANRPGCLISPHQLHDILTGMIDAGEYRMDG